MIVITMSPGATIKINPANETLITCTGSVDVLPFCGLKFENGYFYVTLGNGNTGERQFTQSAALDAITAYRNAGICK